MATRATEPANQPGAVAFLANRAETLGFWASIAGLLLVTIVTVANLVGSGADASALAAAERRISALEARDAEQSAEITRLRARLDSLQIR